MFEISKLNFSLVSREDNPTLKEAKNINTLHSVIFDYDNSDVENGCILQVTSVLADSDKNSYNRYEEILIYFEQEYYLEIDDDIVSNLIHVVIKKHGYDLGLAEDKVKLPSTEDIKAFIDSL